jgi:hypothetical protein
MLDSAGSANVQVQVIGYYTGPIDPSGGNFTPAAQDPVAGAPVTAGSPLSISWPANAPAASTVATEWLLVDATSMTAAGTLSVYSAGNNSAGVQVNVSPGASTAVVVPIQRTSSDGSAVVSTDTAAGSVIVDVVGYTLIGTTPAQPYDTYAAPVAGGAYLTWFAPCADGGSPVSQYEIIASPGGASMTVDGTKTSAFMYGLTDGTSYSFEILAINAAGAGPASAWTPAVTPAPTVPDPPDQPGAQAGDSSALVSWDTPARNGDSAITGYTITGYPINSSNGISKTVSGAATHQLVFTGLTNGTTYTFQVEATNAIGTGQASVASISVTPAAGAPLAPALTRRPAAKPPAAARPVTACRPLAALPKPTAAAGSGAATTTLYAIGGNIMAVSTPPASLDVGTASLATLHKYHYALQIKTTAALAKWQRRIGHSHAVPIVPCVMAGFTPSGASARFGTASCAASYEGTSSATPGGPNPAGYTKGVPWTGIVATAHDRPPPPALGSTMDTGDPFQSVEGEWQQTTNAADPGGTNLLSTWVGIGGWGIDSHDPLHKAELIQAGTDSQTNNTIRFWWEVISSYNGVPALSVDGISGKRTDVIDTQVIVLGTDKAFPLGPIAQQDFTAGQDTSSAVFNWFDMTDGQNATFTFYRVFTDYDGRTAEWINEPPIGGSQLAALPEFAPINWDFAEATASDYPPYTNSGTPWYWNWIKFNLWVDSTKTCVAGPTNIAMTPSSASWDETWHPSTGCGP